MPNFVPIGMGCLEMKAFEVAQEINNDPKLLPAFFHHAKLALQKTIFHARAVV